MKIAKNSVVTIDYTVTDHADGEVIDSSKDGGPMAFIHGVDPIIPGLLSALEGRTVGEQLKLTIQPEEAYGQHDEDLVFTYPKSQFEDADSLEIGMELQMQADDEDLDEGEIATVIAIEDDMVTVDGNHPLAGLVLDFDVTIREVRVATAEELSHGHVHGEGGHHH